MCGISATHVEVRRLLEEIQPNPEANGRVLWKGEIRDREKNSPKSEDPCMRSL